MKTVVNVYASGPFFLVTAVAPGQEPALGVGLLVDAKTGEVGPATLVGSILAHAHVSDPWEEVDPDGWPESVRAVADAMAEDPPAIEDT